MPTDDKTKPRTIVGLPPSGSVFFSALFLIIILLYPLFFPDAPYIAPDTATYQVVAADLADFHLDDLHLRTPGYPLLLALTGSIHKPGRTLFYVSLCLHFAVIWILAALLHSLRFPGWCLNLLGVTLCMPPFMEQTGWALTEILAEFVLTLAFAFFFLWLNRRNWGYLAIAGMLLGISSLVRPTFQLAFVAFDMVLILISAFLPKLISRRDSVVAVLVLSLSSCFVAGSFAFHNYTKHQYFEISPGMMPASLSSRTAAVLERLPDQYAVEREIMIAGRDSDLVTKGSSHTGNQYYFDAERALMEATGLKGQEFHQRMTEIYLLLIRKAPLNYLMESLRSCITFWFPYVYKFSAIGSSILLLFWTIFQFAWIGVFLLQVFVLGGAAVFSLSRGINASLSALRVSNPSFGGIELTIYMVGVAILFYTMVISCFLNIGDPRYRIPLDPILLCLCFIGGRIWWNSIRR